MESDNEDAAKWLSCFSGNIRLNWFYWLGQPIILCASAPSPSSSGSSPHPWSSGFLTQVQPNFFPCRSHLACSSHDTLHGWKQQSVSSCRETARCVQLAFSESAFNQNKLGLFVNPLETCLLHPRDCLRSRHASVFLYLNAAGDLGVVQ